MAILTIAWLFVNSCYSQPVAFTHEISILNPVSGFTVYADCAVDMNGDHLDDVVRVGGKGVYIDYQQRDGSFNQVFFPMSIQSPPVWSVCAGDLDRNGFNELLFASTELVSFISANHDGTAYTESVMPDAHVGLISQRSTIVDIDNDGWLDAFVCNDTNMSIPYRNLGMGVMIPDTSLIQTSALAGSYSAIWADYDNDNDVDLYISKCKSGAPPGDPARTNLLYRRNDDGSFTEVGAIAGLDDNGQSWSTAFEDFDNDGDLDAFVINHGDQNRLFRNNGDGTFTDVIGTSGLDLSGAGVFENVTGDFNNDGYVDIFSELSLELYLGRGDLTFVGQEAPSPPGAIADLNNDGFLDVTKNGQVWLNDGNEINHWLKIVPFGIASNRNGIGARVEIYGDWGMQIREVRSGQGYSPMQTLTTHFGLGISDLVDSLVIRWPSGNVTRQFNLNADTTYQVAEVPCVISSGFPSQITVDICPEDTIALHAPQGFAQYLWSNGDTTTMTSVSQSGKYDVILFDQDGCGTVTTFDVHRAPEPVPSVLAIPGLRACQGQEITLVATSGQNPVWSNGGHGDTIVVTEPGAYSVSIDQRCGPGQISTAPFNLDFLESSAPMASGIEIGSGDSITLHATCENCFWYDRQEGGVVLFEGSAFQTSALYSDTVFYVEDHVVFPGQSASGGKIDVSGGGGISVQTGFLEFEVWEPFLLESVRVYLPPGAPEGLRFVQLFSPDTLLAFKPFQVVSGWNDLELDFQVPVGQLSLHCPLGNLYRDRGTLDYPYAIGDAGQILSSSFGDEYYYYFYDWKIRTKDVECVSERIPVFVTVTGMHAVEENFIEVYPNPSRGDIVIHIRGEISKTGTIRILEMGGQIIRELSTSELQNGVMSIQGMAAGIYIIQIQQDTRFMNYKMMVF